LSILDTSFALIPASARLDWYAAAFCLKLSFPWGNA
jgi:hypothetical protein